METRDTFVIILFRDPVRSAEPRGLLRHVATSHEATFRTLEELNSLLREPIEDWETCPDERDSRP